MDQDIYELLEIPKERHLSRRNSSGKLLGNDRVKDVYSNIRFNKLEESITDKENTIAQLNQTISSQKQQITDMVSYVNGLESRNRQLASAANSARQNLDQAEFWARSGDDFFSRQHYNQAKSDLGGSPAWP